jgi:hypothetical protein
MFFFVGFTGSSQAAPLCTTGTLTEYVSLGSCSVGSTTFSNFSLVPISFFAIPIPASEVTVVPFSSSRDVGLQFVFNVSIQSPPLKEIVFGYDVSGPGFNALTLGLSGSRATAGVVEVFDRVCIGGTFIPATRTGCSGVTDFIFTAQLDEGGFPLSSTISFPSQTVLGIVSDVSLDVFGGGSAALEGPVSNSFTLTTPMPEPTTGLLLLSGLAWLLRTRRRQP